MRQRNNTGMNKPLYLSTGPKIWLIVCSVTNAYVVISYSLQGYFLYAVPSVIAIIGFMMMLLLKSRWGFVLSAGVSVITVILNFSSLGAGALMGLVNPLLTWLVIKREWQNSQPPQSGASGGMNQNPYIITRADSQIPHSQIDEPAAKDEQPEEEEVYVKPQPREDMTQLLKNIDEAIIYIASGKEDDTKREYLISKGRISRTKIQQYIKAALNSEIADESIILLMDTIASMELSDNDDFYIDMLISEPFCKNKTIAEIASAALINLNAKSAAEKLELRCGDEKNEDINKVIDYYRNL